MLPAVDPGLAEKLEEQLRAANVRLAREKEVPKELDELVRELSLRVLEIPPAEASGIDPYILLHLQRGVIASLRALDVQQGAVKRRELRIALERMRQAVRDIRDGTPVADDVPVKDVLRWLVETLDVPQASIAEVLDVNPRTFQRWLSTTDRSEPHDEDALKVRVLSRVTNQLRHGFSGPGVFAWLVRPHPDLKGESPLALLDKRQNFEHLERIAAAARSSAAS